MPRTKSSEDPKAALEARVEKAAARSKRVKDSADAAVRRFAVKRLKRAQRALRKHEAALARRSGEGAAKKS